MIRWRVKEGQATRAGCSEAQYAWKRTLNVKGLMKRKERLSRRREGSTIWLTWICTYTLQRVIGSPRERRVVVDVEGQAPAHLARE